MGATPNHHFCSEFIPGGLASRLSAVGVRRKYWPNGSTIKIAFIGGTAAQRKFVQETAAQWLVFARGLSFEYVTDLSQSDVRISFVQGAGSWSTVGLDCFLVGKSLATMNFGWLDVAVVLHEFGHMLGLGHEHQNPNSPINWNRPVVYTDLKGAPNYWSEPDIDFNVLSNYDPNKVDTTPLDGTSIMMYQVIPSWTLDGFSVGFNTAISTTDASFIRGIYPSLVPEDETIIKLRGIFQTKRELAYLTEGAVVRIGKELGFDVDAARNKPANVETVATGLGLV